MYANDDFSCVLQQCCGVFAGKQDRLLMKREPIGLERLTWLGSSLAFIRAGILSNEADIGLHLQQAQQQMQRVWSVPS